MSTFLPDKLYEYFTSVSVREPAILRRLREETASNPQAMMQVPPEHGQFLALLVQLMGARRTLEVGVFTGYSSPCRTTGGFLPATSATSTLRSRGAIGRTRV
jgi:predicted O-methyltransferase YrrM